MLQEVVWVLESAQLDDMRSSMVNHVIRILKNL